MIMEEEWKCKSKCFKKHHKIIIRKKKIKDYVIDIEDKQR